MRFEDLPDILRNELKQIVREALREIMPELTLSGPKYVTEKQACSLYATNRQFLLDSRNRGLLRYRREGRRVKYAISDLDEFFKKFDKQQPVRTEDIVRRGLKNARRKFET